MRFDGDIIITDPCYVIKDEVWLEFCRHYESKLPTFIAPDKDKISCYEEDISVFKLFIEETDDPEKKDVYTKRIKHRQDMIDKLNKEENFVAHCDFKQPAYNCLDYLGFSADIVGNTIYGDWSASVFNTDTKEKIGDFCADAGMYCVLLLEEAMKHNPEKVSELLKKSWCVARINDFHGDISVELITEHFVWDGKDCTDISVEIVGKGNVNFRGRQTGF